MACSKLTDAAVLGHPEGTIPPTLTQRDIPRSGKPGWISSKGTLKT